jgi:hypothetical protein
MSRYGANRLTLLCQPKPTVGLAPFRNDARIPDAATRSIGSPLGAMLSCCSEAITNQRESQKTLQTHLHGRLNV